MAQERKELKRAIETLCPDLHPETIEDFFCRMDQDYFSLYTPFEISTHIRLSCTLDPEHPVKLMIIPREKGRFDIIIIAFDYFSEFSIICGLLASFDLDIQAGNIYTLTGKIPEQGELSPQHDRDLGNAGPISSFAKIVDIFNVRLWRGETFDILEQEELEKELNTLIVLLREGMFQEARERLTLRLVEHLERIKDQFSGILYPVEVRFDNHASREWTLMDIHSKDTPAFLYAVSNALSIRDIYIHKVRIQSIGTEISDCFYISDRQGRKIRGEREQRSLRMAVVLIKQFTHFLPQAPDPARAILAFDQLLDKFMEEKRPGHLLSFISEKEGLDLLAHLLGASDFLWEDFLRIQLENLLPILEDLKKKDLRGGEAIRQELTILLAQCKTYEEKKRILNAFKDREIFFVDMKHLLGPKITLTDFSRALTDLTDAVLDQAYLICHQELTRRYGLPLQEDGSESPFSICGLGKFGGREIGYASDIELLFLYGGKGCTDGKDSIENGLYFELLARELVNFIEARQEGIFHIDLRLRPYGTVGSLANPIDRLMSYYSAGGEAAQFERQALIKLRWVAGDEPLGRRMEAYRDNFVYSGRPLDMKEALHLRQRQVDELVKPGKVNVKYSPGGIIDIEYAAQYLQILHGKDHAELRTPTTLEALDGLCCLQVISKEEHGSLREAYIFLRRLIDALRIVRGNAKDLILPEEGPSEFKFLARRLGYQEEDWGKGARRLAENIRDHMRDVHDFFEKRFHPSR